jgi:hypothetical protein
MRATGPALALLVAALAAAPASARTTRADTVTATVHKTGHHGTDLVYKGIVRSKVFGRGQVTEYVASDLTGRLIIRYARGTVRGRSVAHFRHAGGSGVDVYGTYRLTGGTGRFKHIRGHGRFTGHSSPSLQTASFRQHGRVSY